MTDRPQRHVYINENTHVKYGETNEKQSFCLTCGQFSPCHHNTLIDQYEAWEKKNPRLERLDEEKVKKIIDVDEIKDVLRGHLIDLPFRLNGKDTLRSDYVVKKIITLITRKLKGQDNEAK